MEKRGVIAEGVTPAPEPSHGRKLLRDSDEKCKQAEARPRAPLDDFERDLPRRAADEVARPDR